MNRRRPASALGLLLSLAGGAALAEPVPPAQPTAAPAPAAQPTASPAVTLPTLGRLEQRSVGGALRRRGLTVEPAPLGKRIAEIHVENQEVFSADDWYFQLANHLHRTTREQAIRRELLFRPGELYDPALVDETTRNLQDFPDLSSVVVIVPVVSAEPGAVDVLVVTRDVFSLRFNTDVELQAGTLVRLDTSLSENNLFGWRKQLSMRYSLRQGSWWTGPLYLDRNVLGTRLVFSTQVEVWGKRGDGFLKGAHEGTSSSTQLKYPLYALGSRWGAGLVVEHIDRVDRVFQGTDVRLVDLASTPDAVEAIPFVYRARRLTTTASLLRRFPGRRLVQDVELGHQLDVVRPQLTAESTQDEQLREGFAREFLRDERLSTAYAGYALFTPTYAFERNLDTFDLREPLRLGPRLDLRVSRADAVLGSERSFVGMRASLEWRSRMGGGVQRVFALHGARVARGELSDHQTEGQIFSATPMLGGVLRLVAQATATVYREDTQKRLLFAGGDTGLRGYAINEFSGKAAAVGHLELRTRALSFRSLYAGAVGFYDVGHAARTASALRAHHDVGIGLRLLIPQFNYYVIRFDWAVALRDGPLTRAGLPGRISAGFRQSFN